jgi:Ca-activated chloride channel family protein
MAPSDPNGGLGMAAQRGAGSESGLDQKEAMQRHMSLAKSRKGLDQLRAAKPASPGAVRQMRKVEDTIKLEEQVQAQSGKGPHVMMSDGSVQLPPGGSLTPGFHRPAAMRPSGVSNSTASRGQPASPRYEAEEAAGVWLDLGHNVTTAPAAGASLPMSGAGGMPGGPMGRKYQWGTRGLGAGGGFGGGQHPLAAGAVPTNGPQPPVEFFFEGVDGKKLADAEPAASASFAYAPADRVARMMTVDKRLPAIAETSPGNEAYEPIIENPFVSAYEAPLSTFGIDVDTASYANVRRFLTSHQLPPPNAVRIEELVNYFSYDYPQPADEKPFAVNVDAGACPWNVGHTLVRIGLKGREIPRDKRPASNLVFLVDVSGSMQPENKLPLVKMGLNLLTQQMTESDRVAIVTYSDTAVQRLESTNGTNKPAIQQVIESLQAGGSTNGADGIRLAYRAALEHFIDGGTNRVILCTDGDFNVGVSSDDELVKLIQERTRTKIFFSVLGFGMGNLKDGKLEKLADKGNGQYAYIDSQREAQKVFVEDLAGTLVTIAKDVKVQVEFNPNQVGGYRLIGYENRVMAAQDFNNDAKDAGDIGAGHTVTALYEVLPAGALPKPEVGENLRYRKAVVPADGPLASELMTVKLRYKQPEGDTSTLIEVPVAKRTIQLLDVAKEGEALACAIELRQIDARSAANTLTALFGTDKENSRSFDADETGKRLLVRASSHEISQVKTLLLQLGEGGSAVSRDFNWAAAVAAFGMILRDSQFRGQASFDLVLELAQAAKGEDPAGRRQEFIDLVRAAKALVTPVAPTADAPPPPSTPLTREQAEAKASVNGKYKNLLRIIDAPDDSSAYGGFSDYGRWEGTSYRGQNNLPQGYWVYVAPHWYIWGDLAK